jgi:molybdenum cofactor biosynthesis protein B
MGFKEHKEKSLKKVSCVVITISDTRNEKSDKSGNIIKNFLKNESHEIVDYKIIKDEPRDIKEYLEKIINIKNIQAIILNG